MFDQNSKGTISEQDLFQLISFIKSEDEHFLVNLITSERIIPSYKINQVTCGVFLEPLVKDLIIMIRSIREKTEAKKNRQNNLKNKKNLRLEDTAFPGGELTPNISTGRVQSRGEVGEFLFNKTSPRAGDETTELKEIKESKESPTPRDPATQPIGGSLELPAGLGKLEQTVLEHLNFEEFCAIPFEFGVPHLFIDIVENLTMLNLKKILPVINQVMPPPDLIKKPDAKELYETAAGRYHEEDLARLEISVRKLSSNPSENEPYRLVVSEASLKGGSASLFGFRNEELNARLFSYLSTG